MSKRPYKDPPMKDIELALSEVLDDYRGLSKAKRSAALEKMLELIDDEDEAQPKTEEVDDADDNPTAA